MLFREAGPGAVKWTGDPRLPSFISIRRAVEVDAADRLPPLTTAALDRCAVAWSAANVLAEFRRRGWFTRRKDAEMAALITELDGRWRCAMTTY